MQNNPIQQKTIRTIPLPEGITTEPIITAENEVLITTSDEPRSDVTASSAHKATAFLASKPELLTLTDEQVVVDINTLIAGLKETDSKTFLKNMEQLLRKISVNDLWKHESALDILFKRYTKLGGSLGGRILDLAALITTENGSIDEAPLEFFTYLEEKLQEAMKEVSNVNDCNSKYRTPCKLHIVRNIPPDTLINASHGGGWRYIIGFLSGKQPGYQLEKGGKGIQISPNYRDRDEAYAERHLKFDTPAILRFSVEAQYIESAVNYGYEAGLTSDHLDKISDIELINLKTEERIKAKNVDEFLALLGLK